MKDADCIFCKLANGDIPTKAIYEDEYCKVIMDLAPATKGHSLIIPKEHYSNLYEIPEELAVYVMKLAKKMAIVMTEKLHCQGFNLIQNNGKVAGQTVMHYHMHLIPRYEDDGQHINWVPGEPTETELEEIYNLLIKLAP